MLTNLIAVFEQRKNTENKGITFIDGGNTEVFLSYGQLYNSSLKALHNLQEMGLKPGNELVFQIDSNRTFIIVFWACILGGIIPVPLSVGQNEEHKKKLFNIWPVLNNPYLVIHADNLKRLTELAEKDYENLFADIAGRIINETVVLAEGPDGKIHDVKENDIAFIQFSSGSTGNPKGVMVTHKNLVTNINAISKAGSYTTNDAMISWMPLTHDMGLIGFHLNPLFAGMNQYLIPTNLFIRRPGLWLDKASQYQTTVLCSPNFGYSYILKNCITEAPQNWDLSKVRLIFNGAEPVSVKLCHEFLANMLPYGLKTAAMCPVYGLAEATLAVTIPHMDDEVNWVDLDRNKLNPGNHISYVNPEDAASFVNVGKPVSDCSVRIADEDNNQVADLTIGHIQIKGDNVTQGYYNNPIETSKILVADGWLKTGDLGFFKDGSLYITGRAKDIIFINGQNFYPHDIEAVAEEIPGVGLNKMVVTGYFNPDTQRDETVAFIFHRGSLESFMPVYKKAAALINSRAGFMADHIIPVKNIPRTTSGKLQRFVLRDQFNKGVFDEVKVKIQELSEEVTMDTGLTEIHTGIAARVAKIWSDVLKTDMTSSTADFFKMGGNSLKAAQLSMKCLKEFKVELPIQKIYEKPTIQMMALEITQLEEQSYEPIAITAAAGIYPASSVQKRLYYLWELDRTSVAYNIPLALKLSGKIDAAQLQACTTELIKRHDALRMNFELQEDPGFRVHEQLEFEIGTLEITGPAEIDLTLKALVRPFNLNTGALFNITLVTAGLEQYLFFDFHHIISDGISIYNFITELFSLYGGNDVVKPSIQYKDYAAWENGLLKDTNHLADQYWREQLKGEIPVLELPLDTQRPAVFNKKGSKIEFELSEETTLKLKEFAAQHQCTLHVLLFAVYNVLLAKYTGQEDLMTGIPVSGRHHPDLQQMQGVFVNSLALRTQIKGTETFSSFLQEVNQQMKNALKHQDYVFDDLIQLISGKQHDASRNKLFDTMFIYQNMGLPAVQNQDFTYERYFFDPGFSKYDLSMEVFEYGQAIVYGVEYATSLFKKETILQFADSFQNLVKQIITTADTEIAALSVLKTNELEFYAERFSELKADYPATQKIHQLFEDQAVKTPEAIAIEFDGITMTYQQLNDSANRLANYLHKKDARPGSIIAVLQQRSPEMIISILAILKTGAAYLPVAIDLPESRISYLLTNSQCKFGLTDCSGTQKRFSELIDIEMVLVNELDLSIFSNQQPIHSKKSNDLAYVIYTSGTTGNPKGVMVEHKSLVNYIFWAAKSYVGAEKSTFPLFTSVSFDLTVTSIFTPLITGNKILIYKDDLCLEEIIGSNQSDIIKLTPSHLKLILESNLLNSKSSIRRFIVGGEDLDVKLVKDLFTQMGHDIEIFNEYGPTEATVGCMIYKADPDTDLSYVPIGIPANNTRIYILDQYLKPVATGVHGEIYIAGDGLARGYLFNEELTVEKFITDPFVKGQKMYKTGDIAKQLPDGNIVYIGRHDLQVKLNGYRIELQEIEKHLTAYRAVSFAVVTLITTAQNQKVLCAYYISRDLSEPVSDDDLRNHLAGKLPHYMIPVYFVQLDEIPLTQNGKVNFAALPEPGHSKQTIPTERAQSEIEEISLVIWEEVLGAEGLTVYDNFFELGGDSIKAVQIVSRLYNQGISLNVKDILTYHTIASISAKAVMVLADQYEQEPVQGKKTLSPIESWFFTQDFENPAYFNQSILLKLNRELDLSLLEKAFVKLVEQHDSLRMNYDADQKELFFNSSHLAENFIVERLETTAATFVSACEMIKGSFDIQKDLLFKAALFTDAAGDEKLFLTAHHLLVDGLSWRILLEDLYNFYHALLNGETITIAKTASLKDWQTALAEYASSDEIKEEEAHWSALAERKFEIPVESETMDWSAENALKIRRVLDDKNTAFLLKEAHHIYQTDVPVLLNTALALTLKEWTLQHTFIIEQENHGRHLDGLNLSRTLGWFTAMYPVKIELISGSLNEQIKSVKEQLASTPGKGLGYGVRKYSSAPDLTPAQQTEIRFNYLGQFDKELNNDLFSYSSQSTGRDTDPVNKMTAKLELNCMVVAGGLSAELTYNQKAHQESTMNWFMELFFSKLESILYHIKNEDEQHFTPSDFDAVTLDQEELDSLF